MSKRQQPLERVWVRFDPMANDMMRLAALYVLFAVLDKTGGFSRKKGVTKRTMSRGVIRSFIFPQNELRRVLQTLNAYDAVIASRKRITVAGYSFA